MGIYETYQDVDMSFSKDNFSKVIHSYIHDGSWQFQQDSPIDIKNYTEGKNGFCFIMRLLK